MLRHIVMVTYKPEATPAQRSAMQAAIVAFEEQIPEVRSLTCGDNIGSGPNHHDFAIVADFDDLPAFRRYIESDAHKAYVEIYAKVVVEKLAAIQHEC